VVAIMDRASGQTVPFDIATLNTFIYDRSDPAELVRKLVARIGLALDIEAEEQRA
jgi:hypothetical protein